MRLPVHKLSSAPSMTVSSAVRWPGRGQRDIPRFDGPDRGHLRTYAAGMAEPRVIWVDRETGAADLRPAEAVPALRKDPSGWLWLDFPEPDEGPAAPGSGTSCL